ncbi:MAG: hypothetical protein ACLR6S_06540 [Lacrimispora saccharolytica]
MLRLSCEKAVITVPPAEGLHVLPAAFDRSDQKPREPQQKEKNIDTVTARSLTVTCGRERKKKT